MKEIKICILDVESSGLHPFSYPIEIAWLSLCGTESDVFIINPETARDWSYWCYNAQCNYHQIDRNDLIRDGIGVADASNRLSKSLADCLVITDAVGYDEFWVTELLEHELVEQTFRMIDVREYAESQGKLATYDLFLAEMAKERPEHRALPDCRKILIAGRAVGLWN